MPRAVVPYPAGLEPDIWAPHPASPHHRFLLGRLQMVTSPGELLVVVGMNPSHATEKQSDATVNVIANGSACLGYAGWLMLNLYPERSPKPGNLGTFDKSLSDNNCAALVDVVTTYGVNEVLGAWGDLRHDTLRRARNEVLGTLSALNTQVFHFGTLTMKGEPRHPSPRGRRYDFRAQKTYLEFAP